MSIPVPNLDDRSWKQIVDEAIRLIPRYTPEWTNHNPSDPGITLLELYAWMTEMVIYRLNKVPEKNFLTFLDLIGVRLLPPEAARVVLSFQAADGAQGELLVAKGTQVATVQAGGEDPVTFETVEELKLLPVKLVRAVSSHRGQVADHTAALLEQGGGEPLFCGVSEVERFLYLGDDRLAALDEEAAVDLFFEPMPGSAGPRVPAITEWQYFDGKRWRDMVQNRAESGPNRIAFHSHPGIAPTVVNGIETCWVRGKLAEPLRDPKSVQLDTVQLRVEILGEGIAPESAFVHIGSSIFLPVDQGGSFNPFGEEPRYDCAVYLAHGELFAAPEARIRVEIALCDPSVVELPDPSPDLQLFWEYWNGRKWAELGRTSPMGVSGAQGPYQFLDSTCAFSKNGTVIFDRPRDLARSEVGGVESFWIRARINGGNYGAPGSYELVGQNWVFKEDRPLRPPCVKSLVFKYVREPKPIAHCVSFNDFHYRDHTDDVNQPYVYFQPFLPDQDENPALYLAFDRPLPSQSIRLYFALDDQIEVVREGAGQEASGRGPRVVWELWDGSRWLDLLPEDGTRGFTRSGYLVFDGPKAMPEKELFGARGHWMRARLESGAYDQAPVLRALLINAANALNGITVSEIAGSSDGSASQRMALAHHPILQGAEVWVLEFEPPSAADRKQILAEEGAGAIQEEEPGTGGRTVEGGAWVRWHPVDNFFDSGPTSRHFLCDPIRGELLFGDGIHGFVPPAGRENVKCIYRIGGGATGNVGAHTLTVLKQSIAFVQEVDNPFPASGGADAETIEEAKRRGTHAIKNRDRAVTAQDFEDLAIEASRRVARARCIQNSRDGSVRLVVVPKRADASADQKAIPSRDLLDRVAAYIDQRRLITAQVHVGRPRYAEMSVEVGISLKPGTTADRAKADIRDRLKRLLHPLQGGPKGDGWPFGRSVGKGELFPVIEGVEGVERVGEVTIIDEVRRLRTDTLRLAEDELPALVDVTVNAG